jgi:hypothetical protein
MLGPAHVLGQAEALIMPDRAGPYAKGSAHAWHEARAGPARA